MFTEHSGIPEPDQKSCAALARRFSTLMELSQDDKEILARMPLHTKLYQSGQNIFEEGLEQNAVFLCQSGWGARYRILPDGERQVVDLILPGSLFGGTINPDGEHIHSAEALMDMKVVSINIESLRALSEASPRLACALAIGMGEEGTRLSERIVSLGRRDAFGRLAHFFLELRYRLQGEDDDSETAQVHVPIPQKEMADFLGLTSVHISRTMCKMADEGLIEYDDVYVDILDVEGLTESCGFEASRLNASPVPFAIRKALLG